eukprot:TRINITY_DN68632_c0_g1_i1.p1 TRINITY_DN68632_c0_g1~~TRINITY_DN68632_c0_g1_i1.p1  ORF type:complete len:434 (+),score=65.88 TRINITY_DN68632_c0_g1_i1:106-1407(+)
MVSSKDRIAAEARLLRAISTDDSDALAVALGSSGCPEVLLSVSVKETLNDPSDETAFYHSVASFGLQFRVGDKAVQLAKRSGKRQAASTLATLCHSHGLPYLSTEEERIQAEDRFLRAISADDADAALSILEGDVPSAILLNLAVKDSFGNESDTGAFFHSVASYSLRFEIGDTAERLAERNGRVEVARALKAKTPKQEKAAEMVTLHVLVHGCAGDLLAQLDIENSSLVSELIAAVCRLSPLAEGSHLLQVLHDDVLLDPDLPLYSYFDPSLGNQSVYLNSLTVVGGTYRARIPGLATRNEDGSFPRWGHTTMCIMLLRGGKAKFEFVSWPVDRGRCAGSGGRNLEVVGKWCVTNSGTRITLTTGTDEMMQGGRWGHSRRSVDLQQQLLFRQDENRLVFLGGLKQEHLSSRLAVHIEPETEFERLPADQEQT